MRVRRSSITTCALGVDLLGIEEQVLHAVGFEVDDEVELVGGDVDVVRRHVLRGERVVLAAVLLDEPRELRGPVLRRALEHHVLEEVRDAGAPRASLREPTRYQTWNDTIGLR